MAGKTEYKNKFAAEKYDRIGVMVPKGKKGRIKLHSELMGESLNGFINRAIDNQIERDNGNSEKGNE